MTRLSLRFESDDAILDKDSPHNTEHSYNYRHQQQNNTHNTQDDTQKYT